MADDEIICPSVANRLSDVWIILLWPFFVVSCGLLTGYVCARISNTPNSQIGSCLVSCAFGNSTGLVMTLLTVIHDQFKATTELGSVDATAFLSVYLLLYPVLQWGVGGWLMAPPEDEVSKKDLERIDKTLTKTVRLGNLTTGLPIDDGVNATISNAPQTNGYGYHRRAKSLHLPHILNDDQFQSVSAAKEAGEEEFGGVAPVRIIFGSNDEEHRRFLATGRIESSINGLSSMIKELSFVDLCLEGNMSRKVSSTSTIEESEKKSILHRTPSPTVSSQSLQQTKVHEGTPLLENGFTSSGFDDHTSESLASKEEMKTIQERDLTPLTVTLIRVAAKVFQP